MRRGVKRVRSCWRLVVAASVFVAAAFDANAQSGVEVAIDDGRGRGVPFAVVWSERGRPTIADSLGRLRLAIRSDSVRLQVRRIGFREFNGVVPVIENRVQVTMRPVALMQDTIRVVAAANTPPVLRGFYDRAERVRRGAILGDFFAPEEIVQRNASRLTDLLRGSRYVRVSSMRIGGRSNVAVLRGRSGCGMTILVDGLPLKGSAEEVVPRDGFGSVSAARSGELMSVDDLVNGRAVLAVEVYPSTANAPAELKTLGGRGDCGIVAVWTGSPE